MKQLSQQELLNEKFWDFFKPSKSPILKGMGKVAKMGSGAFMGATKGIAKALEYVAPEITQPLHRFEAGMRDIGDATRRGYDVGYGGLKKEYGDILLDAGYVIDDNIGIVGSGKNKVAVGYRIIGKDGNGKPIPDLSKQLSFLIDKDANVKIIKTSAQDTSSIGNVTPPTFKKAKSKKQKMNKPKVVKTP
jgi:hypothetical protein